MSFFSTLKTVQYLVLNLGQCTNNISMYSNTILDLNFVRMNLLLDVYNYIFDG